MSRALTYEELIEGIERQTFIRNGLKGCVEGLEYDFRVFNTAMKFTELQEVEVCQLTEPGKPGIVVQPGDKVFVLSKESLALPENLMARLLPKSSLELEGIKVFGNFQIDPYFSGKLFIGLQNVASCKWTLEPKRRVISAVFYKLR